MFSQQRHSTTEPHCIRNGIAKAVMPQIAANDQVHASAKAASSQSATRLRPSTITKGTSFTKGISLLIKPPQGFVARDSMPKNGGPKPPPQNMARKGRGKGREL